MNGTLHMNPPAGRLNRLMRWPLLCGLLGFMLATMAVAQPMPLYDNESSVGPSPITIDATNFLNNGTFTVDYLISSHLQLYSTFDTLNYTNNGLMIGNNGFQFDTFAYPSGPHSMASTFNNAGTIRVGSAIDGYLPVDSQPPELIVAATNIYNSGTVVVGQTAVVSGISGTNETSEEANGLLQYTGQTIDLSRGTYSVESTFSIGGSGAFGIDTNGDWEPDTYLQPNYADSSDSSPPSPTFNLDLANSTPYYAIDQNATNNVVFRAVFVENDSSNVVFNVYIPPYEFLPAREYDYGTDATIEWIGTYMDSATGNTLNNYLYLTDYALNNTTNVLTLVGKIPSNFTFTESPTRLAYTGLATSAFPTGQILPVGSIVTNQYSFAAARLIDTSVDITNLIGLTNIPGRIQINASRELNLSLSTISGLNYLSLNSTNQYDESTNARIFSPYSDFNIGKTNGSMTISNLTESSIPLWNGPVQCWSGRWVTLSTNAFISTVTNSMDTNIVTTTNFFTVTNDFRVLIVGGTGSLIAPTTPSQVQDMTLHAPNSIVISDTLNILRNFSIDAESLTLTTNGVGKGAESLDGELNLQSASLFWSNCVPNLRNLTNNGAIRLQNFTTFGAQTNYYNFINTGLVADQGSKIWANNFISSGTFSNGIGSFTLQSTNTDLSDGLLVATNGSVSITTGSLLASNLNLQAGRSLTLSATSVLTDGILPGSTSVTGGNMWTVGANAVSGQPELSLPIFPTNGASLLGTTITNIAPTNKNVIVTWAGKDSGASSAGFTNNMAVGRLILDALGTSPQSGVFTFNGADPTNAYAIYVDYLEFDDAATNETSYNFPGLSINTNITIYFAQAMLNGVSVAEKIDNASRYYGANNGRLRWVPTYAGHYSSTNIVYPGGATSTVNAALAQSTDIDSDGDGIYNAYDPTPFFLASELNFTETLTNVPPKSILLSWQTVPGATNYVYYTTNLASTGWSLLQTNSSLPANPFVSPQPEGSSATSVSVLDSVNPAQPKFYKVTVQPWLTYPY